MVNAGTRGGGEGNRRNFLKLGGKGVSYPSMTEICWGEGGGRVRSRNESRVQGKGPQREKTSQKGEKNPVQDDRDMSN